MATQAMRATGDNMQPLPTQKSPTLSVVDMVLPKELPKLPTLPSPPRNRQRPPSPTYLKEQASEPTLRARSGSNGNSTMPAKREKRGLMSRKMMLLRSRTASNGLGVKSAEHTSQDEDSTYASSPTIKGDSLAQAEQKMWYSNNGESPSDSDDLATLPQFLAKYESNNMSSTDDELESSPVVARHEYAASDFTINLEAERRQKEEEEQQSAMLSKRAEQILANAKKRLNVSDLCEMSACRFGY